MVTLYSGWRKALVLPVFWLLLLCLQQAQAVSLPMLPVKRATPSASAASAVAFAASLDTVITTLESEQQRTALVEQLKHMRTVASAVVGENQARQNNSLLGQITSVATWLGAHTDQILTNQIAWAQLVRNAGDEFMQHVASTGAWRALLGLLGALGLWAATAWLIRLALLRTLQRLRFNVTMPADPSTLALLVYAVRIIGPWALAFALTVLITRDWVHSVGGVLGFLLAWCVLCGAVFAALGLALFSLCAIGHRKSAVRLLLSETPPWLIVFGAMAALNDACDDVPTQVALGMNVCFFVMTVAHLVNIALLAAFTIHFRRPIAQLIRNNSWTMRSERKAVNEILQFIAVAWPWPILAIAVVAGLGILGSAGRDSALTDQAVRTVLWLVLAFFASLLIRRRYHARLNHPQYMVRRSAYVRRVMQFMFVLATVLCWLLFFELILHTWHHALSDVARVTLAGRRLGQITFSIATTVCISWLVWIVLDAMIEERITGKTAFRRSERVSNRARTVLPLLRNALLVVIVIIAAILSLANLGINVTPLLAGAGVVGLAVGFGAQALVQDLITGIFILAEDTIAVGDMIDAGGHIGTVEGITIRTVRLRDAQGAVHSVPFSQIKAVKNMGRDFSYAVFEIGVAYNSNMDQVLQVMRDTGRDMSHDAAWRHMLLAPLEVQGLERFDASAIVVRARFRTLPLQQWNVTRAFNLRLKKNFDKAGISLPFPQMDVHLNGQLGQAAPPKENGATA